MALMAVAFPILPGKTDEWRAFMHELNGPRRQEFVDSRKKAGVHELTFLQPTPMGDLVIVTLDGDDPARSFGQLLAGTDAFSTWFRDQATRIHGIDPSSLPAGSPSELVVDSEREVALAG